ncbi:Caleosin [Spinellus fusiger]|nr:Caleosin [Spinellus fusiger]
MTRLAPDRVVQVVKKHFYYWDHSNKGYITPIDAFQGCTELGYSTFYSVLLGTMMCMFFSYATQDAWIPDPFFRVRLSPLVNTEAYSKFESNGQFDRDTFESLFMAHAKSDPLGQTITMKEFITMMRSAKSHGMTWKTPLYEWCTLYIFAGHHGSLRKQDVMAAYNTRGEFPCLGNKV